MNNYNNLPESVIDISTEDYGLVIHNINDAGMGLRIKAKSEKSVVKFVNNLKLFGHGYSWGGFESLALHQNVREQGNRRYLKLAKNEHIVRLHIGLEDPSDLIADIKQSLKHLK